MPTETQWRSLKRFIDAGWRPVDLAKKFPSIVTAKQIYSRKKKWAREAYYNDPRFARFHSKKYKLWRASVFRRDGYRCRWCKTKGSRSNPLQGDHIIPWSVSVEKRYLVSNGRCLCKNCHQKTSTWGFRAKLYKGKL